MKTFFSFSEVGSTPKFKVFLWVVLSFLLSQDMYSQLVNPGNISFWTGTSNSPEGYRRIDVIWSGFSIPPNDPNVNYRIHVGVRLTTNVLVAPCINQPLTTSSQAFPFPAGSISVSAISNTVNFDASNIDALGITPGEGGAITLFSIYFAGAPMPPPTNTAVYSNWDLSGNQPPMIWTLSGTAVQTWPMTLGGQGSRICPRSQVSGSIYKPSITQSNCSGGQNAAVTQVQIMETANETCIPALVNQTITNQNNGNYVFNLSNYFDYTISPQKTNGRNCGLNGQDITIIQNHQNGTDPFDYPYQLIAADMNLSGTVTAADQARIQEAILGNYNNLPANWRSWAFPPTSVYSTFPPPTSNTFNVPAFSESLQFNDLIQTMTSRDFVGIKRGDVDGSCTECNANFEGGNPEERESIANSLIVSDRSIKQGETIEMPLMLKEWDENNNVISFAIEFDPDYFELVTVKDGALPHFDENSFNWEAMKDGLLRCVWVNNPGGKHILQKNDAILNVVLKAKASSLSISGLISLRADIQDCSIVTTSLNQDYLGLEINANESELPARESITAHPNPFGNELYITLHNQEVDGGEALLEILSIDGRKLYTSKVVINKGTQSFSVPANNFPSGLLTYRLIAIGKEFSGKVVKQ